MKNKILWGCVPLLLAQFSCFPDIPLLPPQTPEKEEVVWLNQNWNDEDRHWFHHETQGTRTVPLPYDWFLALEQPIIFQEEIPKMFRETKYLTQFGFIPSASSKYNPDGLPIGFARTKAVLPGEKYDTLGWTCAACHTGQMTYEGKFIRIDGAPAMVNFLSFNIAVGFAMFITQIDYTRSDRFAKRVLGDAYSEQTKAQLMQDLEEYLESLKEFKELEESVANQSVEEGVGRLDALNRIGNQVFGRDMGKPENYAATTAPVNFPPIWTTQWFNWAQYNGSIRQPLVRNVGEALGVYTDVKLISSFASRYKSSIPIDKLYQMEDLLAGDPPTHRKKFSGLLSPQWPDDLLGSYDREKAREGHKLYRQLCQHCHLPPLNSKEIWKDQYWEKSGQAEEAYLKLKLIPVGNINTDPGQASIFGTRMVNTLGTGLNTTVCDGNGNMVSVGEKPAEVFGYALGAIVENTIDHWWDQQDSVALDYYETEKMETSSPGAREKFNGNRRNCIRASYAYRPRPLNGMWATGPFLHNGSVPTLYDLLSPVKERPKTFYVGNLEFDPIKVGYRTEKVEGATLINTEIPGNLNTGHEFNDGDQLGVIGRKLSENERFALIEYLKTL